MFEDFLRQECSIYKKTINNTGGLSKSEKTLVCKSKCRTGSATQKDLRLLANIKDVPVNISKIYLPPNIELKENYIIELESSQWNVVYPYQSYGERDAHHIKALISKI